MVLRIINILLVGFDHDILVAKKFRNSYLILMFSIWFIDDVKKTIHEDVPMVTSYDEVSYSRLRRAVDFENHFVGGKQLPK